jgi:hypothetical protein
VGYRDEDGVTGMRVRGGLGLDDLIADGVVDEFG